MERREFIMLVGGAAALSLLRPPAARARRRVKCRPSGLSARARPSWTARGLARRLQHCRRVSALSIPTTLLATADEVIE